MIHWLLQAASDLPDETDWLTPAEQARYDHLATAKRRRDWLLGRWTAKRLLQAVVAQTELERTPLQHFQIDVAPDGAPRARGRDGRIFALSLSHSGDRAFAALLPGEPRLVGADLERIAPRADAFVADYFTAAEAAQVDCAPAGLHAMLATGVWSAKEAALKAVRLGLTVDTRAVEVRLSPPSTALAGWSAFAVRWDERRLPRPLPDLQGWWRLADEYVLTLAAREAAVTGATA